MSTDNWTAYADLAASGELQSRVSVLLLPAPIGGSADDVRKGWPSYGAPSPRTRAS
ncbi:hypothetical protein ACFSUJ_34570 [Streptomyces lusitanus]|uniref:hypothetical protein n=1 Tax=Streptomyces lusitanus TaxID=68232 RepID=UPI0036387C42